jgi:hypothetical protein
LGSSSIADNLISILCGTGDRSELLRKLSKRIRALPPKTRDDAWSKLLVISELRRMQPAAERERTMPIDLMDISITREMYLRGEADVLRIFLNRRFGEVPDWVATKLA